MGYFGVVFGIVALASAACASVGDNTLDGGERVVLVAPVLAPPRDSKTHSTDRARQFPILVLLAQQNAPAKSREQQAKSLDKAPQPIYVQKLEDQKTENDSSTEQGTRQKRHLFRKKLYGSWGGGGGGCDTCGGGGGGGYYQPATVVIIKEKSHGHGGGGYGGGYHQQQPAYVERPVYHQQPSYGGCNGGCGGGGGYGGGQVHAEAHAYASSSSSAYGKK